MKGLRDRSGAAIDLGKLIAEGGEGAVYDVIGRPDIVAKLYKAAPDSEKEKKLALLAAASTESLLRVAAWPTDVLRAPNGRLAGITMPRVTGCREIHSLYSPKQRPVDFPNTNWQFLVWAARNAAAAVETVHAAGHVIGDINQKGFLVGRDSTVRLIDCDSFQISANGSVFLSLVGVPEFTPPELHGQTFSRIVRTQNHDAFGLAVLIFHVLCMGRHPFAGRFQGHGDMPLERAIREHRFAYSQSAAVRQMVPPPHSLAIAKLSFPIASLFERAFAPSGASGQRPSAAEWRTALTALKEDVRACAVDGSHKYHKSLPSCPWCEIEAGGGPVFFITTVTAARTLGATDLERVYAEICAMSPNLPSRAPVPHATVANPTPVPKAVTKAVAPVAIVQIASGLFCVLWSSAGSFGALLAALTLGVGATLWAIRPGSAFRREYGGRKGLLDANAAKLNAAVRDWASDATTATQTIATGRKEADALMVEYRAIPRKQQEERQALERQKEATQRKAFLEQHYIRQAKIQNIGSGLANTLASFGFETAEDISQNVLNVPGIGSARYASLMAWRQSVQQRFRFDPRRSIDPRDIAAIDNRYASRRQQIERHVVHRKADMLRAWNKAQELTKAGPRFEALAKSVASAKADVSKLTRIGKVSTAAMIGLVAAGLLGSPSAKAAFSASANRSTDAPEGKAAAVPTPPQATVGAAALPDTCKRPESVCVFSKPSLDASIGTLRSGTLLPSVPRQAESGWFTITLSEGAKGYIRSVDVSKLKLPVSSAPILP